MVDRILGYIGDYYVKLDGQVDALVFSGGIGEKSALLRKTLAEKCRSLGVAIDSAANDQGPEDNQTVKDISQGGGRGPRALICQTNEQVSILVSWLVFRSFQISFQFEMVYRCVCSRSCPQAEVPI